MLAVSAAAVVIGLVLLWYSLGRDDGDAGGNLPVNAGAHDSLDVTTHNSPALARNPADADNLAVANRIDAPFFSCALHVSFDGGESWSETTIPFPAGEEQPPRCFAPDVAFGADGQLYVSFVTLAGSGNHPNAAWVSRSTDGGRTLSTPVKAAGRLSFQLRLVADPIVAGRLWLSWLQAADTATLGFPEPGYPIVVARSDDGGQSWSDPVRVSPPSRARVLAPTLVAGTDGRLAVLYVDLGDDSLDYHGAHTGIVGDPYPGTWSLVLARSPDGGLTWSEAVVEPALVPTERVVAFTPPVPALAIDEARGRVYAAYQDGRLGDADVWMWASHDGGSTFSAVRVNDTPTRDGTSQYRPALSVAPDGRLDVVYYDRRADPNDVATEASFQSSTDGGRTWDEGARLSDRAFDSGIGTNREGAIPDQGSQLAVVSGADKALAAWTDARAGTRVSNKQDIVLATVDMEGDESPARATLLAVGVAALIFVFASSAWRLRAERRHRQDPHPTLDAPFS